MATGALLIYVLCVSCATVVADIKKCSSTDQDSHCDTNVYSTYDNTGISVIHASTHPVAITCYAEHICLRHYVYIVWFININNNTELQYSQYDSDILHSEFGISLTSTCPEYECKSTLVLPCLQNLNNTQVSCGAYTEVCPDVITSSSSTVTIITETDLLDFTPPLTSTLPTSSPPTHLTLLPIIVGLFLFLLLLFILGRLIVTVLQTPRYRQKVRRKFISAYQFIVRYPYKIRWRVQWVGRRLVTTCQSILFNIWLRVRWVLIYLTVVKLRRCQTFLVSLRYTVVESLHNVRQTLKWIVQTCLIRLKNVWTTLQFRKKPDTPAPDLDISNGQQRRVTKTWKVAPGMMAREEMKETL